MRQSWIEREDLAVFSENPSSRYAFALHFMGTLFLRTEAQRMMGTIFIDR